MRKSLEAFTHFFVQEAYSRQLLNDIGFKNVTISGDTRFDRVSKIAKQNNSLDFMAVFKGNKTCLVAGSTWQEDEEILLDFINGSNEGLKFVIAPHNIKRNHIEMLQQVITKPTCLYSEFNHDNLINSDVLIMDSIGLLTKVYSYADFAYVGGGFATGLHNTLEPAVFGIPVIIGPQYQKFNEAIEMVQRKGVLIIKGKEDFRQTISRLLTQPDFKKRTGAINMRYVQNHTGATANILNFISTLL